MRHKDRSHSRVIIYPCLLVTQQCNTNMYRSLEGMVCHSCESLVLLSFSSTLPFLTQIYPNLSYFIHILTYFSSAQEEEEAEEDEEEEEEEQKTEESPSKITEESEAVRKQKELILKQMQDQQKMIDAKKDEAEATRAAILADANGKMNVLDIDVGEDEEVDIDNI